MKEKERIAAVRQRAHDEVQTLRNKIEQTQDKIDAFDEERGSESELQRLKTILKTILNGLNKNFMICNSNKKRNPKKKSINKEQLLLPKKRKDAHSRKDSTARNHSTTLENRNPSLKH